MLDGHSILEYDLNAMAEKPWRRAGSDLSDWFNYGFDEMTWQMYCNHRQNLVEHAGMLKTNVLVCCSSLTTSVRTYFKQTNSCPVELLWFVRRPTSCPASRRAHHGHGGCNDCHGRWRRWARGRRDDAHERRADDEPNDEYANDEPYDGDGCGHG